MFTYFLLSLLVLLSSAAVFLLLRKNQPAALDTEGFERTLSVYQEELRSKDSKIDNLQKELSDALQKKASAEALLQESEKKFAETESKLTQTFEALAGRVLHSNSAAFLDQAKRDLNSLVKPLEDSLKRYEDSAHKIESSRHEAYGGLKAQIESLLGSQQELKKETGNLVSALRRPEIRGRWGELALRRVVELAGMTGHVDFSEQVSIQTEEGRLRPDLLVHLPSQRDIVVDSKVALDAYLDAVAAAECDKEALLNRHSQQFRKHMKDLSSKNYQSQFDKAPEFVVMFIPGEAFLSAALEKDPSLIEDGMQNQVILATPTTLVALLRAVAFGWRQEQLTQHAEEVAKIGRELYERFFPFIGHIQDTGNFLSKSVESFNKMIGSFERNIVSSVQKFKELGAGNEKDLPALDPIDETPRKPTKVRSTPSASQNDVTELFK